MPAPVPHLYLLPDVVIDTTDAICHFSQVQLFPNQEFVDVETYCNPGGEAPGKAPWRCILTVRMSYGTDGAWAFFSQRAGQLADFVVSPGQSTAPTSDNPSATFEAYIPAMPFIPGHTVGQSATFDLECRVVGEPVFAP